MLCYEREELNGYITAAMQENRQPIKPTNIYPPRYALRILSLSSPCFRAVSVDSRVPVGGLEQATGLRFDRQGQL